MTNFTVRPLNGGHLLLAVLLAAAFSSCTEGEEAVSDLGHFLPEDVAVQQDLNFPDAGGLTTTYCRINQGEFGDYLFIGGQVLEMTVDNQDPGILVTGVQVDFYDYCGELVGSGVSGEDGTFAFNIEVGVNGFDGYSEYTLPGYPLFRQFDKWFVGDHSFTNFRLFKGVIFDGPLMMVGQQDHLGFIQGSVYNLSDGAEVPGATVQATSGTVIYFSDDLPVPDEKLKETQSRGVFFIYNVVPGEVKVALTLPDGRIMNRYIRTWPVDSHPEKTITQVGVPVDPAVQGL